MFLFFPFKVVQVEGQRDVFVVLNSTLHYISFNTFVSMGFDFADVIKFPTYNFIEQMTLGQPV